MDAAATAPSKDDRASFGAVAPLVVSAAAHVAALLGLRAAPPLAVAAPARAPVDVEIAPRIAPAPRPAPTPHLAEPARAPSPRAVAAPPARAATGATRPVRAAPAPNPAAAPPPTTAEPATGDPDAPLDFTHGAAPGAIGGGDGSGTGGSLEARAPPRPAPATARPAGPRMVDAASLSQPPRAPALDAVLARHYPPAAREAGVTGAATLRLQVLPDGTIGAIVRASETFAGFAQACERTVRGSRWGAPLDRDGLPVATWVAYTCRFELRE